mmetsp:Transcript_46881/g.95517  ORF Transcript_46881/g.95517 Transcript_46881/m.95517 type:complete len:225 (-) Transcript_46881:282-956(-)
MMSHSASTMDWYWAGSFNRTSALEASDCSSSSRLRSRILGFSNRLGCCSKPAYEKVRLKATPLTKNDSVTEPPGTFFMPTSFRSISSSRQAMQSTTSGAKKSWYREMSLEFMLVLAHFSSSERRTLASSVSTSGTPSSRSFATATFKPRRKARTMTCGCTPSCTNGLAADMKAPAITTTEVVPSPISASWDCAMSTRVLAAGCTTSSNCMIVAPSLEMVTPRCP